MCVKPSPSRDLLKDNVRPRFSGVMLQRCDMRNRKPCVFLVETLWCSSC